MRPRYIYIVALAVTCLALMLFVTSPAWSGTAGTVTLNGSSSGTVVITPQSTAGTPTLTLPNASGTFAVGASAPLSLDTATGNLTLGTVTVPSGGTGLTSLSSNVIYKGNGTGNMLASGLTDSGTIVSSSENIDVTSNAVLTEIANAGTTGTAQFKLAKLTGAPSKAVVATTSDTGGVVGVVISASSTTGNAQIAVAGQATCAFDGNTTAGDYVQISTTTNGDCHDTGAATYPTSGQVLGRVLSTNTGVGNYAMVLYGSEIKSGDSGTVSIGTQYQMAYYAATGSTVSGDANITTDSSNDLLVTSGKVSIGTSATLSPLYLLSTQTGVGTAGLIAPYAPQWNDGDPIYENASSLAQITTSPTSHTSYNANSTGIAAWLNIPASNGFSVLNPVGVHGVITNASTSAYNGNGAVGASGLLGEVYNKGTLGWGAAVGGTAESDSGSVGGIGGGNFYGALYGGTVGDSGLLGSYNEADQYGGSSNWINGVGAYSDMTIGTTGFLGGVGAGATLEGGTDTGGIIGVNGTSNQTGGTSGYIVGTGGYINISSSTTGEINGLDSWINVSTGTIDSGDVLGVNAFSNITGGTIEGNINGAAFGAQLLGGSANFIYGVGGYPYMTAGTSGGMTGVDTVAEIDGGALAGNVGGVSGISNVTNGSIGWDVVGGWLNANVSGGTITDSAKGISAQANVTGGALGWTVEGGEFFANLQGGTANNVTGIFVNPSVNGGTLNGDIDSVYIYTSIGTAATVTGNKFGLFIDDDSTVPGGGGNYAIWQNNSAQTNYFAGNVGIGAAPPVAPLQIGPDLTLNGNWPTIGFNLNNYTSNSYLTTNSASMIEQDYSNGGLALLVAPVGTAGAVNAPLNEAFFIQGSSGFIGIGTTNPQTTLNVYGALMLSNPYDNSDIMLDSVARPSIWPNGPNTPPNQSIQLTSIGTGALQLNHDSGGNINMVMAGGWVGIATETPQSLLHVYNGEVQVGSSGANCTGNNAGALRYSGGVLYYCSGSTWTASSASGSSSANFVAPVTIGTSAVTVGTAGIVTAYAATNGTTNVCELQGKTNNSSTTVIQSETYKGTSTIYTGITFPVAKNDTFTISPSNCGAITAYFTALSGTGTGGGGSGSATAAGSDKQIQFNDGGTAFGADSNFNWDYSNHRLGIGSASPIYPFHLVNTQTASGTAGMMGYYAPQWNSSVEIYDNPAALSQITASPTADTNENVSNTAVTGWLNVPSSTHSVLNALGVHGIVTNASTAANVDTGVQGFYGALGEVYNTGNLNWSVGTGGAIESDSGTVGDMMGGQFVSQLGGGTVGDGIVGSWDDADQFVGSSAWMAGANGTADLEAGTTGDVSGVNTEANMEGGTVTDAVFGVSSHTDVSGGTITNGLVGVGAYPYISAGTAGYINAVDVYAQMDGGTIPVNGFTGLSSSVNMNGGSVGWTLTSGAFSATLNGGTANDVTGIWVAPTVIGTGTLNGSIQGISIYTSIGTGGTVTGNKTGLYIDDDGTVPGNGGNYAIYQNSPAQQNYFAGEVGIGASPAVPLQIGPDLALQDDWPTIGFNVVSPDNSGNFQYLTTNSGSTIGQDYANGGLGFWVAPSGTAGSAASLDEALFIQGGSNNVGIGTISPQAPLQIGPDLALEDDWPTIGFNVVSPDNSGNFQYLTTNSGSMIQQDYTHGGLGFWVAPSGTTGNTASLDEAFFIQGGGNIGIGTTNPLTALQVIGTTRVASLQATGLNSSGSSNSVLCATGRSGTVTVAYAASATSCTSSKAIGKGRYSRLKPPTARRCGNGRERPGIPA